MKFKFKTDGLVDEWRELLVINPDLVFMVMTYTSQIGTPVTITEIFRTEAMQRRYYRNSSVRSVHQEWRGVDVSVRGVGLSLVEHYCDALNELFPYDETRSNLKSFLLHDTGMGMHLHIQNMV